MARLFLTPINMNQNEVQNLRIQNLGADPTTPAPVEGQIWFRSDTGNHRPVWRSDTASNHIYPFASTNTASTGVLRDGSGDFSAGTISASLTGTASQATALNDGGGTYRSGSYYLDFSHTTGTRDHAAISDFDTQVRSSRLDQMAAPTASVSMNNQKITSLLDPTQPQDAATMAYVDSVAQGLDVKASSRIATTAGLPAYTYYSTGGGTLTANINGAFPLTDDKTLGLNESILVKNETATLQKYNGIYTLTQVGTGSLPWILTRRSDANTSVKFTSGLYTYVAEGTVNGSSGWVVTTPDPIDLNTTPITFTQFSGAGQLVGGDGISILANTVSVRTTSRFTFATGSLDVGSTIAVTDGANNFTVKQVYATPTNSTASINLPHGVAPGTPVNGDVWTTTGGLYVRIDGTTISFTSTTLSGSLTSGRVPFANGTQSLTDSAFMTFSTTNGLSVNMASSGANNLTIGSTAGNSLTSGADNTFLGTNAGTACTAGQTNTAIGSKALETVTASSNTAVGYNAGGGCTTGASNVFIGAGAGTATGALSGCVVLGYNSTCTADSQFVCGSSSKKVLDVYFGGGVTSDDPTGILYGETCNYVIHATGGIGDNNLAGATLGLAGGKGTGSGIGGRVFIQTAPAGSSGGAPNSLIDRLSVSGDGGVSWIGIATTSSPAVSATNNGTIFYDSTLQKFRYSVNGGAYADLVVTVASTALDGTFAISNTSDQTKQFKWSLGAQATGSIVTLTTLATQATATLNIPVITTSDTLAMLGLGQTFTGSNIFQNAGNKFLAAATQDAITIAPRAGGTNSYVTSITTGTLTGSYIMTIPATAAGDTFMLLGLAQTITGAKSFTTANLTITDVNIVLSATTGTQFGTATTQKLGFYGATAVVQPIAQDVATALTTLGLMATGGTYAAGSVSGTLAINHGGTGLTSTSQNYAFLGPVSGGAGAPTWRAIDAADLPAAVTKKYATSIGDGTNTVYTVNHALGTKDVVIRIFDNSTGNEVEPEVVHTSTTDATITFAQIPTTNAYRVVVVG